MHIYIYIYTHYIGVKLQVKMTYQELRTCSLGRHCLLKMDVPSYTPTSIIFALQLYKAPQPLKYSHPLVSSNQVVPWTQESPWIPKSPRSQISINSRSCGISDLWLAVSMDAELQIQRVYCTLYHLYFFILTILKYMQVVSNCNLK